MSYASAVDAGLRVATAAVFVWLGMVLAISFVEAPLKFRAPGVTLQIGLGIGRLVFRALNQCEFLFAIVIALAVFTQPPAVGRDAALSVAGGVLVLQTLAVRPMLTRRTTAVLAGEEGQRSVAHRVYIALEVVKIIALITGGVLLLRG